MKLENSLERSWRPVLASLKYVHYGCPVHLRPPMHEARPQPICVMAAQHREARLLPRRGSCSSPCGALALGC